VDLKDGAAQVHSLQKLTPTAKALVLPTAKVLVLTLTLQVDLKNASMDL
jgi:hypothetical protein